LHTIILREQRSSSVYVSQADVEARLQPLILAATDVLKKHEADENGKKWVQIWHRTRHFTVEEEDTIWTKVIEVEP
jgi:hypothetical protein